MTQKYFKSTITVPHGIFTKVPEEVNEKNNILVKFKIEDPPNTISVTLMFDDTTLEKSDAMQYSLDRTESLGLELALKNSLSTSWNPNCNSSWTTDTGKILTLVPITGRASIARAIEVTPDVHYVKEELINAVSLFNKALQYRGQPNKDRETAWWLHMCWEALCFSIKEHEIKTRLIDNGILERNELKKLKYTFGRHYRHLKGEVSDSSGKVISLKECVNKMRNVLEYFDSKEGSISGHAECM